MRVSPVQIRPWPFLIFFVAGQRRRPARIVLLMSEHADHISPQLLLRAYCQGIFPMARGRTGPIDWYSPDPRGILPLEAFHISRSLSRRVKRGDYHITRDKAFEQVIRACSDPRPYETGTWISDEIVQAYTRVHHAGLAHSVEAWVAEKAGEQQSSRAADGSGRRLVGGLYGVALGGAFFAESMFRRATDASKVCLVHLVEHLRKQGFVLLDVQYPNRHLRQFGVIAIGRDEYLRRLDEALRVEAEW